MRDYLRIYWPWVGLLALYSLSVIFSAGYAAGLRAMRDFAAQAAHEGKHG